MKNLKNRALALSAFIALLGFGVWHEVVSLKISTEDYYNGTVVDKTVSVGRSSTHYLYIDWDNIGMRSIVVNPVTYKVTKVGDSFSTEYGYIPIFGAAGIAYVPDSGEYGVLFAITGFFSKLACIILLALFTRKHMKSKEA